MLLVKFSFNMLYKVFYKIYGKTKKQTSVLYKVSLSLNKMFRLV